MELKIPTFSVDQIHYLSNEHPNQLARLIELSRGCVYLVIKGWQDFTSDQAILASAGETYASLAAT